MGTVNYGTSDYITTAYNCNTEYAPNLRRCKHYDELQ